MSGVSRREAAFQRRVAAAQLARDREHESSLSNGEEGRYRTPGTGTPSYTANFTKGLAHRSNGALARPEDYIKFIRAIDSGDERDIRAIPLGPLRTHHGRPHWRSRLSRGAAVRAWESMGAGNLFSLMGPDAQAVAMPPAPALNSCELIAEVGELYLMALLRDVPFAAWGGSSECDSRVQDAIDELNGLHWFAHHKHSCTLTPDERGRKRGRVRLSNLFRGITPGVTRGPYISQFLLVGTAQLNEDKGTGSASQAGLVRYGAASINQRVPVATEGKDYLTDFATFLDVQDGADLRGKETYAECTRFISTPRDLCTFVHYDALYQAYLTACIILLNISAPLDPGIPFQRPDSEDKQQGFAHFGGPHILALVCEVSSRALRAVRFQKFNVHRRVRPEAVGGLVDRHLRGLRKGRKEFSEVRSLAVGLKSILGRVAEHNHAQNIVAQTCDCSRRRTKGSSSSSCSGSGGSSTHSCQSYLMPMAYPEGSPMHPSYGAGHACVAGACVTILKAFFDTNHRIRRVYAPTEDGFDLCEVDCSETITVGGELNKLAENVAIGRGWAGVHYFSDYIESMRLGEKVAIGLLEEQKLLFEENFYMSVDMFDGKTRRI